MKELSIILMSLLIMTACHQSKEAVTVETSQESKQSTQAKLNQDNGEVKMFKMEVNGKSYAIELEDNETALAFSEEIPTELNMDDVNGNEKYFMFEKTFPSAAKRVGQVEKGDIMLWGDSGLVIFYESFSTPYSYTKIGKVKNAEDLDKVFGANSVTVTFENEGEK